MERVTLDGNRAHLAKPMPIAPYDRAFADFYPNNGILSVEASNVAIRSVRLTNIANFAILLSAVNGSTIERVIITASGSLNEAGVNNTTGGILLEEGASDFTVKHSRFRNVRGNAIWTHSRATSDRNSRGLISQNHFVNIGRDAIQIGHATKVRVEGNSGSRIGYPAAIVDMKGGGTPVAIDTAGNVDNSVYTQNHFEEINGKCIDLDGFHHGDVTRNICRNRQPVSAYPYGHFGIVFNNTNPDMRSEEIRVLDNIIDGTKFGGIFVIGRRHTIQGNRLLRLNQAGCNESHVRFGCIYNADEPEILQTGIYLGSQAERPDLSAENRISGNTITGYKMAKRCIASAPSVDRNSNTIKENLCLNR